MYGTLACYVMILRGDFINYCDDELRQLELSKGLLYFLLFIGHCKSCSPGELAKGLQADTGYTTRSVHRLVQDGFVSRERNQHDKRVFALTLTHKGEAAYIRAHTMFDEWDSKVLQSVADEDKKIVMNVLSGIINSKEDDHCVRKY